MPSEPLRLAPSPRLYVRPKLAAGLADALHSPYLQTSAQQLLRDADRLARTRPLREGSADTWQQGTRSIDRALQCLTCAWVLTGQARYRRAALRHLANLSTWNQISCEANRETPPETPLPFCLSYGELACTVGLMFDLFHGDLGDDERQVFMAMLDRFLMREALHCIDRPPWWAHKEWSNWNGVCAGGIGVMALAVYDDVPEAQRLIPFVEESLTPYFQSYVASGGGCHEGTGYWNYGMNYAMRYLLSWENATGRQHPALEIAELGKSLLFPVDFSGITFGDNDGWHPTAFYFLMARRLGMHHAALRAATFLPERVDPDDTTRRTRVNGGDLLYAADAIPTVEEMARLKAAHRAEKVPVARVYHGMDWAALADDEAFPSLRMALRGGSSAIKGHGMLDLLSIRCRVDGKLMITDQQDGAYMASTFSRRGHELYGRSAASKSTLFVDGLGCTGDAACDCTEAVSGPGLLGIRVDGSRIYLPRWKDRFIGRLVLLVDNAWWLVVDHVLAPREVDRHWAESRFHTGAAWTRGTDWVRLENGGVQMTMTFAALGKAVLQQAFGMPSQPQTPRTTIFRWMGAAADHDNLHAVALCPGRTRRRLRMARNDDGSYRISVTAPRGDGRTIHLAPDLTLR